MNSRKSKEAAVSILYVVAVILMLGRWLDRSNTFLEMSSLIALGIACSYHWWFENQKKKDRENKIN